MSSSPFASPTWRERFDKRFVTSDGCWLWTGAVNRVTGYGCMEVGTLSRPRMVTAHRIAFYVANGHLPDRKETGLVIDHLCEQKLCVRPDHLEAVPQRTNVRRWFATHPQTGGMKK